MKYRVSTYRDGNGKIIYRPEKLAWTWPFWSKIEVFDSLFITCVLEFDREKEAIEWTENKTRNNAARRRDRVRDRVA